MCCVAQDYPEVPKQSGWSGDIAPETVQWDDLLAEALERGKAVPEITWCKSGEDAAWHVRPRHTLPRPAA